MIVESDRAFEDTSGAAYATADALAGRARALLAPPAPETPFGRRYLNLLQRDPAVVVAHGAVIAALGPGGTTGRAR